MQPQAQERLETPAAGDSACGTVRSDAGFRTVKGHISVVLSHCVGCTLCSSHRKGTRMNIIFNSQYGYGDRLLVNQVTRPNGTGWERKGEEVEGERGSGGGEGRRDIYLPLWCSQRGGWSPSFWSPHLVLLRDLRVQRWLNVGRPAGYHLGSSGGICPRTETSW